jgi:beta-xylosidase
MKLKILFYFKIYSRMKYLFLLLATSLLVSCGTRQSQDALIELQNPIIPGTFADPSIVEHEGKFYIYATIDPWGADSLACWMSEDFRHWTLNRLNWPTKAACTSPSSNDNKVWAPSVVKKGDTFYMYVSVGSEVWCGKASHPLGPWENMLGAKPLIPYDSTRYYHVIDAEAFLDDDGKAYLYWGSGWEWINGHCFAAELNDDMSSFKSSPVEITPRNYFEGPFMTKHEGKYYLSYSEGKTIEDTYKVRYAAGDNPFGPFEEAANSPILQTTDSLQVYGPGHHAIFTYRDKNYILYHRHSLPFVSGTAMRQICINELEYDDARSQIKTVVPYSKQLFPDINVKSKKQGK